MSRSNYRTGAQHPDDVGFRLLCAAHRGWVDAQSDPPHWPSDYYDALPPDEQVAYELGRQVRFNVAAAGLPDPGWRGDRLRQTAPLFEAAASKAAKIAGPAFPNWHV